MLHRIFGRAAASDGSAVVESWLMEGEKIIKSFKVWRDEVVVTTEGLYVVNVRGITGIKKKVSFTTKSQIIGVSFQNAFAWDRTVNVRVNLRNSVRSMNIRIRKDDEENARELVKTLKKIINGK